MKGLLPLLLLTLCLACNRPEAWVRLHVKSLEEDPQSHLPLLVLESKDGRRLSMIIGLFEAQAIARAGRLSQRPLTHDLLREAIRALEAKVKRVVIQDLRHGVFYARIILEGPPGRVELDARPSDAVALALRTRAPIYAKKSLLSEVGEESSQGELRPGYGAWVRALPGGLLVERVSPGSRAELDGLRRGDLIVELERHPLKDSNQALREIARARHPLLLLVRRGSRSLYLILHP